MHKLTLAILLLLSTFASAADPKPADYAINVHVSASRLVREGHGAQDLDVIIDGKKYELQSDLGVGDLLALGDYKAKLVQNDHRTDYDSHQAYEFLFPDNKTRRFDVVGQWE
jgi:hypothetical protein